MNFLPAPSLNWTRMWMMSPQPASRKRVWRNTKYCLSLQHSPGVNLNGKESQCIVKICFLCRTEQEYIVVVIRPMFAASITNSSGFASLYRVIEVFSSTFTLIFTCFSLFWRMHVTVDNIAPYKATKATTRLESFIKSNETTPFRRSDEVTVARSGGVCQLGLWIRGFTVSSRSVGNNHL